MPNTQHVVIESKNQHERKKCQRSPLSTIYSFENPEPNFTTDVKNGGTQTTTIQRKPPLDAATILTQTCMQMAGKKHFLFFATSKW